MYGETVSKVSDAAAAQIELIHKSLSAYLVHAAMAGAYIGLAIVLIFIFGTPLQGTVFAPISGVVMAGTFGIALSLVILAGSELFTGNAMIMSVGALSGRTTWSALGTVWVYSWVGNLFGSLFVAVLAVLAGAFPDPSLVQGVATAKMTATPVQMFTRAMLCNWLVVLAVWCNFRLENPVAKLVMIWWCLLAFIGSGYEHSVANMTLLSMANLLPHSSAAISWTNMFYNIGIVTIGNSVSGVLFMGAAYYYIHSSYNLELPDSSSLSMTGAAASNDD